jgi:hypothetical protein
LARTYAAFVVCAKAFGRGAEERASPGGVGTGSVPLAREGVVGRVYEGGMQGGILFTALLVAHGEKRKSFVTCSGPMEVMVRIGMPA